MADVCVLIDQDHLRHPIVRRQLPSLLAAGHRVVVIEPADACSTNAGSSGYRRLTIRRVQLWQPARLLWAVARRIAGQRASEAWWTAVHFLELALTGLRYTRAAVRQQVDCYQAHDLATLGPAVVAAKLRRRRVIYDAHELVSEQGDPHSLRNRVERRLERWLVALVDDLVVPNPSRAEVYRQRCRLKRAPTVVLNCPPTFTAARSDLLRECLGLSPAHRIVLYHGTFMPNRALEELVVSARAYDPGTILVLIGEQNAYFNHVLEPIRQAHGLTNRVLCLPYVEPDRVLELVASADLGIVIYKNTGLNNYLCAPTKLYEFLMAEVPVVVSAFPEMLALLSEYRVGRAFDPADPDSIAAAINAHFRAGAEEQQEVKRALKAARQRYTWEIESPKLLALLETPQRQPACASA
jgi:glycosyltransferase involved in cell wall biosynthesis